MRYLFSIAVLLSLVWHVLSMRTSFLVFCSRGPVLFIGTRPLLHDFAVQGQLLPCQFERSAMTRFEVFLEDAGFGPHFHISIGTYLPPLSLPYLYSIPSLRRRHQLQPLHTQPE